jgi:hypothetical protein
MEESRHLWRIAENIFNMRVQTIDMGDDTSASGQKNALQSIAKNHVLAGTRRKIVDLLMKLPVP